MFVKDEKKQNPSEILQNLLTEIYTKVVLEGEREITEFNRGSVGVSGCRCRRRSVRVAVNGRRGRWRDKVRHLHIYIYSEVEERKGKKMDSFFYADRWVAF